jgi:uncharacterized protein (TIGR02145 family)
MAFFFGVLTAKGRLMSLKICIPAIAAFLFAACSGDGNSTAPAAEAISNGGTGKTSVAVPCKSQTEDNCEYGELVDDRDGQIYKTVRIGDQVWMAENLNYKVDSSFCYNDSAEYCEKYGRLYQWAAAVGKSDEECGYEKSCVLSGKVRGVCPEGWYLPDTTDWKTLFAGVGGFEIAGRILRSQTGWLSIGNGTDAYGFSAISTRFIDVKSILEGQSAIFWTATMFSSYNAYEVEIGFLSTAVGYMPAIKFLGFSVRCLQSYSTSRRSSSSSSVKSSNLEQFSSPVTLATPCKTKKKDNCEYGVLKDDRDGQTYKTVKIGDQWWMAENLNFEAETSFCYNDEESKCTKYGRLYPWAVAVGESEMACTHSLCSLPSGNIQGVCPSGWHLPRMAEWDTLFTAIGGQLIAGKALKSTSGWMDGVNGTDDFGFSALPGGFGDGFGKYDCEGECGEFHSSDEVEYGGSYKYDMGLSYSDNIGWFGYGMKRYLLSVRCIQD